MWEQYYPIALGIFISLFAYGFLLYVSKRFQNDQDTKFGGRYWKENSTLYAQYGTERTMSGPVESRHFSECQSPECARCNKYKTVKDEACTKLTKFASEHGWEGLERVKSAIHDVDETSGAAKSQNHAPRSRNVQYPNVLFVPGLRSRPWWKKSVFSNVQQVLETNFDIIRDEYLTISQDLKLGADENYDLVTTAKNLDGWLLNNTPSGHWCVFHLYNQGAKVKDSCARCPETTNIIESLQLFMDGCLFGNASFSVMYPQTHITEHYGPSNVRLRCHLGN